MAKNIRTGWRLGLFYMGFTKTWAKGLFTLKHFRVALKEKETFPI
jgi:hypothetical protein